MNPSVVIALMFGAVALVCAEQKEAKRSLALGRSSFRPGSKRDSSIIGQDELMDNYLNAKRSLALGRVQFRPGKRSLALGRNGNRPGKKSLALGRFTIRPGKRPFEVVDEPEEKRSDGEQCNAERFNEYQDIMTDLWTQLEQAAQVLENCGYDVHK